MKKIFAKEGRICEFKDHTWKIIVKIGKIYTDMVQKEFFLVKTLKE